MTIWVCVACGVEHDDTPDPPAEVCAICADDRQWVPESGQEWTMQDALADRTFTVAELEPDLYAIEVDPDLGIGQRTLLVRTPEGNLLWEPSGVLTADMVEAVRDLDGICAITASHPHLIGAAVSWSHAFDGVPVYFGADDRRWVRRRDDAITYWSGRQEVLPGLALVQCGGHFPGSCVADWTAGADGRGALLTGDTVMVGADRTSVSFMRSYPNRIPLSPRLVTGITDALEPLTYDRLYDAFGATLDTHAREVVRRSAERYIGWVTDTIRDPDEPRVSR